MHPMMQTMHGDQQRMQMMQQMVNHIQVLEVR